MAAEKRERRLERRAEKRAEKPDRRPDKKPEKKPEKRLEEPRGPRLDTPREASRPWVRLPSMGTDTFGIFAERFARFMGTARFLIWMTVFVVVWITLNVIALFGLRWDPYPFILLNLFFSTQASYAAPLILLAQNRQEDRDRVVAERDRKANAMAHADMEFLAREVASLRMAMGEVATRDFLRSELRTLLQDLTEAETSDSRDEPHTDQRSDGEG